MLLSLFVVLVVTGVLLYCFNQLIVMDARIKNVINALLLLCVFVYVLAVLTGRPLTGLLR